MGLYQSEPKGIYIGNNGATRLPSAYQEVEYLQSRDVGTYNSYAPYINTGFIPNENTRVEWKIGGWTQTGSHQMFGVRDYWGSGGRGYAIVTDAYQFNGNAGVNHGMNDGNIHTGSFGQAGLYVDGDLKTVPATTTFTSPGNLYLFGLNNNGYLSEFSDLRYYYFKIYDNGTLVRDFVPCYKVSDNRAGMYDLVNNIFYINANTSYESQYPFIVGSDVVPVDREIKHVYKGSVQVRPTYRWKPGANTMGYYPLNSTYNYSDQSGNSRDLTNTNVTITTYGSVNCAYFNGSAYLSYYDGNTAVNISQNDTKRTINIWTYGLQPSGTTGGCIHMGGYNTYDDNGSMGLKYNNGNTNIGIGDWTNGSAEVTANISVGWHNVVATQDGSTAKLYIDGTLANDTTIYPSMQSLVYGWTLGAKNATNHSELLQGYLSEVIIENKTWSVTDILNYYDQTKSNYGIS